VDTQGRGVEAITERGVVVDGREYPLDCLIYATGFEVGTDYTRRAGYEVTGKDGLTLTDKWRGGASTLHGLHSHGFPNCFIISNTQSGFSANFPHMINEQARHIGYILGRCHAEGIAAVEASRDAEDAWVATIEKLALMRQAFLEQCTPGYYNNEGAVRAMTNRNASYGAGPVAFVKVLEDWRAEGQMSGLDLTRAWPANA
jgi:cyclohexanone monooxygenase